MTDHNQGSLPIDPDSLRHPMWTVQPPTGVGWVDELRKEIRKRLTPFDGRPGSEHEIGFCQDVYACSAQVLGPVDAAGFVAMRAAQDARKLRQWQGSAVDPEPGRKHAARIETLCTYFIAAIERGL